MPFRSLFLCAAAVCLVGVTTVARADHRHRSHHRHGSQGRGVHGGGVHSGGFHKGFRGGSISGPNFGHHRRFRNHLSGHVGLRYYPYSHFGSFGGYFGRHFGGYFGTSSYGGGVGPRYYGSTSARRYRAPRVSRAYVIERPPTYRPTPWRVQVKMARQGLEGYRTARQDTPSETPSARPSDGPGESAAPLPGADGRGIEDPRIHSPSVHREKSDARRGAILYPDRGDVVLEDEVRPEVVHPQGTITAGRDPRTTGAALRLDPLGQRGSKDAATVTSARKPGTSDWKTVR